MRSHLSLSPLTPGGRGPAWSSPFAAPAAAAMFLDATGWNGDPSPTHLSVPSLSGFPERALSRRLSAPREAPPLLSLALTNKNNNKNNFKNIIHNGKLTGSPGRTSLEGGYVRRHDDTTPLLIFAHIPPPPSSTSEARARYFPTFGSGFCSSFLAAYDEPSLNPF